MLAQPARERGDSAGGIAARDSTLAHARSAPLSLRRYASLPSPPKGGEGGVGYAVGWFWDDANEFRHSRIPIRVSC
jgi:hypothetical protein